MADPKTDEQEPLKMRDLVRLTGVHRETIRAYFRAGLLPEPVRPRPNVAHYTDAHVRAVIAVRHLNRESKISLKQIGRSMQGDAVLVPSDAVSRAHLATLATDRLTDNAALVRLDDAEPSMLADAKTLARVGAIEIREGATGPSLSAADARILELWGQFRALGFTDEAGFSAAVIEVYVRAAQAMAEAEVSRFLSAVDNKVTDAAAVDMALASLPLSLEMVGIMRRRGVLKEMRRQASAPH